MLARGTRPFPYDKIVDLKIAVIDHSERPPQEVLVKYGGSEILKSGIWELLQKMWDTTVSNRLHL